MHGSSATAGFIAAFILGFLLGRAYQTTAHFWHDIGVNRRKMRAARKAAWFSMPRVAALALLALVLAAVAARM